MKSMHFASICTGNRRRASLLNLRIVCGQITSADAAWSQLQVWRDLNQDGISQSNELSTLAGLNITRIGLNGSSTGPQAGQTINNNRVALSTTYTRGGVTRTVGAIDLEANAFFSEIPPEVVDEAGSPVTITETAQALPQMNGSGMVRNLRAAISACGARATQPGLLRKSVLADTKKCAGSLKWGMAEVRCLQHTKSLDFGARSITWWKVL